MSVNLTYELQRGGPTTSIPCTKCGQLLEDGQRDDGYWYSANTRKINKYTKMDQYVFLHKSCYNSGYIYVHKN